MKKYLLSVLLLSFSFALFAQIADPLKTREWPPKMTELWEPVPPKVTPGEQQAPPSDAIVLFDGKDMLEWENSETGGPAHWILNKDGSMTVASDKGGLRTKRTFGDVQLHLEFKLPEDDPDSGQDKGNSGVFLQNRYEVQVLDNYENRTYSNGQVGAIYKQHIPLANASRPAGEWQTYDIIFTAPRFNDDGMLTNPAYITVIHNGVLVQNHVEIKGETVYRGLPHYTAHGDAPLHLQDHDNPVSYRNIWVRKL